MGLLFAFILFLMRSSSLDVKAVGVRVPRHEFHDYSSLSFSFVSPEGVDASGFIIIFGLLLYAEKTTYNEACRSNSTSFVVAVSPLF